MPVDRGSVKFYPVGTQDVKIVAGAAGGTEYVQDTTVGAVTYAGGVIIGVQATTARVIKVAVDGAVFITGGAGGSEYVQATTLGGATHQGGVILGLDATTAFPIAIAATGGIKFINMINTGTVDIAAMPAISGTISGNVALIANTTAWQGYVVATTSAAAGVIVETSGGHTLYVTDLMVSVDGPMDVDLCSETTDIATVYLATKGGFIAHYINPLVCTTNHSFRVVCASSGKCAVSAQGYTVT